MNVLEIYRKMCDHELIQGLWKKPKVGDWVYHEEYGVCMVVDCDYTALIKIMPQSGYSRVVEVSSCIWLPPSGPVAGDVAKNGMALVHR